MRAAPRCGSAQAGAATPAAERYSCSAPPPTKPLQCLMRDLTRRVAWQSLDEMQRARKENGVNTLPQLLQQLARCEPRRDDERPEAANRCAVPFGNVVHAVT